MEAPDPLLAASRGDRRALLAVVDCWWRPMRRWAWLECGDRAVAEDAVQEALLRLVRHFETYDPQRPFEPWLRTLVRNACRDQLGSRATAAGRETEVTGREEARSADPGRELDVRAAAARAVEGFAALSPRQRELVERIDLQGASPIEVAEELGLSAGAVRNQLHTARRRLRESLVNQPEILTLLREA